MHGVSIMNIQHLHRSEAVASRDDGNSESERDDNTVDDDIMPAESHSLK